jgi:hypothetical protein
MRYIGLGIEVVVECSQKSFENPVVFERGIGSLSLFWL